MKFISANGIWNVSISDSILNEIKWGYDTFGIETGGILLGNYNDQMDTAIIKSILMCSNRSKNPSTNYERGGVSLDKLNGLRYLGDWHTHPNNSPEPSLIDNNQSIEFSNNKKLNCPEILLLIIGKNHELTLNVYSDNEKIELKEME